MRTYIWERIYHKVIRLKQLGPFLLADCTDIENIWLLSNKGQLYFLITLLELFMFHNSVTFIRVTKNNYELDLGLCTVESQAARAHYEIYMWYNIT